MARGSIRPGAKGSWQLVFDTLPDPVTGKRKQKRVTVRGTKREAEKELARLLIEADQGRIGTAGRVTIKQFMERWLSDHVKPNLAPKTCQHYAGIVKNHILPHLGSVQLEKLQSAHIIAWLGKLREHGQATGNGPLSATSIHHIYITLHRALVFAVKWKLITVNPADNVDTPKSATPEMQAWDADQVARFLEAAAEDKLQWHAFFTLAVATGMRMGELRGLRWQDVDLAKQTLIITQNVQRVAGYGILAKAPKTASSRRSVSLGADTCALLRKHKAMQNEARLKAGARWKNLDLVFPAPGGGYLEERELRNAFQRIVQHAGVPRIRFHDLRHTAATLLLTAGVNPKVVTERLGHSNVSITLEIYGHVSETMQQQAAATMDTLVRKRS